MNLVKQPNGKIKVELLSKDLVAENDLFDNFALRDDYDKVIRCLGFVFDDSIFTE